jgi:hypothetical protein
MARLEKAANSKYEANTDGMLNNSLLRGRGAYRTENGGKSKAWRRQFGQPLKKTHFTYIFSLQIEFKTHGSKKHPDSITAFNTASEEPRPPN